MEPDQGKVFVGGISWDTTEERLKDYFAVFGEVLETVIIKDRSTGRARGFGFVAFSDSAVADRVLLESHTIDGRVVEVKKAVPKEEQQNIPRSNNGSVSNISRTKKIFVGGLASSVTEEEFRNYFSQFGNITDVVVMYDPATQRPRGFGFITFDSEDAVEKVIQHNTFHQLHEKMVEVKKAVPKEFSGARIGTGAYGGAGRGVPYSSTLSSAGAYAGPPFVPPLGASGGYPSYGPPTYGPAGYGATPGFAVPMSGTFGTAPYGGGAGYTLPGAYGPGYGAAQGFANAVSYGAPIVPSRGYMTPPPGGPRSLWANAASLLGGAGSPVGYRAGGYGGPAWSSGTMTQSNGHVSGYNNPGHGYGASDAGHNSNSGGFPAQNMAAGLDSYSPGSHHRDTTWKPGDVHRTASPASAIGYGSIMGTNSTDGDGYGVLGRHMQHSADSRFRPYPTTGIAEQT